jgi:hypothetical protein
VALANWDGVVAAGGMRIAGTVSFVSAPGVLFQSAAVTEGALHVWAPSQRAEPADGTPAYVVGKALAKEIGLRDGSLTALTGEPVARVLGVLDSGRRNPQVQRWLLDVVPPAGTFDECWVEFSRESYSPGLAALAAWFAAGSKEPIVRPYTRKDEFTRDPLREFHDRPQRYGWLAAGGLIGAVFLLSAWFRRSELGLYLAIGTGRLQLVTMLAADALVLMATGAFIAAAWGAAIHAALGHNLPYDHLRIAGRALLSSALLGLAVAPWASSLVARGNIASLLKDR